MRMVRACVQQATSPRHTLLEFLPRSGTRSESSLDPWHYSDQIKSKTQLQTQMVDEIPHAEGVGGFCDGMGANAFSMPSW